MPGRDHSPELVTVILDRVDITQLLMGYSVTLPKLGIVLTPSTEMQRVAHRCRTRFAGAKTGIGEGK